jgi:hypothetical protein
MGWGFSGFWNNFLLLPVHKSRGSKVVTHFIAIQKDISVVKKVCTAVCLGCEDRGVRKRGCTNKTKHATTMATIQQDTNAQQWTPPECAMYD